MNYLLSCSKTIMVHQLDTRKPLADFTQHRGQVSAVTFNHSGQAFASAGVDGKYILYRAQNRAKIIQSQFQENSTTPLTTIGFSHQSLELAVGSKEGLLKIWDLKRKQVLTTIRQHRSEIVTFGWSHDSRLIASASKLGDITVHRANSGTLLDTYLNRQVEGYKCVKFYPDAPYTLGAVGGLGNLTFWDCTKKSAIISINAHKKQATSMCFISEGRGVLTCGFDQMINMLDFRQKKIKKTIKTQVPLSVIASQDNDIAVGTINGSILVYDIRETTSPKQTLLGHQNLVKSLEFKPKIKTETKDFSKAERRQLSQSYNISDSSSTQSETNSSQANSLLSETLKVNNPRPPPQTKINSFLKSDFKPSDPVQRLQSKLQSTRFMDPAPIQHDFTERQKYYIRDLVQSELVKVRTQTASLFQNMHVQLIRQFHIQQKQITRLLRQSSEREKTLGSLVNELRQENERLRKRQI